MRSDFIDLDRPAVPQGPSRVKEIEQRNRAARIWTLVLDDDPTGTQTVRDVHVLTTDWSENQLEWASRHPSGLTFALTNSRSLDGPDAGRLTHDIVATAAAVAHARGLKLRVVSRSDSTLRGHFAVELAAVHTALTAAGVPARGTLFVPAFLEAGRVTARDIQWVETPAGFVPAATTEFAQDATFGYEERDLRSWVAARTGSVEMLPPTSISLIDLRTPDGAKTVHERLSSLSGGQTTIANAVRAEDLETLMMAVLDEEEAGHSLVIRSGPSFVRLCGAQLPSPPLQSTDFPVKTGGSPRGLVVIGSHTELTNSQVAHATTHHRLHVIDMDGTRIIPGGSDREVEIQRCAREVTAALEHTDVLFRTSREVLNSADQTPLEVSTRIAGAVVDTVRDVMSKAAPSFLIAKGGITSSDMAVRALGVRKATVVGQMLPGLIPVWKLLDGLVPDLPYVIFPGNVGTADTLTDVLATVKS